MSLNLSSPLKAKRSPQYLIGDFNGALLAEASENSTQDSQEAGLEDSKFRPLPGATTNEQFCLPSPDNSPMLVQKHSLNFRKHFQNRNIDEPQFFRRKSTTIFVKDFVFIEKLEEQVASLLPVYENIETRERSKTMCPTI